MQFGRNVGERDLAVGQVDAPEARADDVVVQPGDQVVGAIGEELDAVCLGHLIRVQTRGWESEELPRNNADSGSLGMVCVPARVPCRIYVKIHPSIIEWPCLQHLGHPNLV